MKKTIKIINNNGSYLPLFNLKGLKSSITPFFGGDLKTDHNHYFLEPTTDHNLYQNLMSRNVIFTVNGKKYYLNGQSPEQVPDDVYYTYGLLYQKVFRKNELFSLDTLSFVAKDDNMEIHRISITNHATNDLEIDTITAIPIYGRSADNLRDHRHVTSLLNQINLSKRGIHLKPTLSFDERGHLVNTTTYSVLASFEDLKINRMISNLNTFIGGGSIQNPNGIYQEVFEENNGYEAIGGIGFEKFKLRKGETKTLTLGLGIFELLPDSIELVFDKYIEEKTFRPNFDAMKETFKSVVKKLNFEIIDEDTSKQLQWVTLQPLMRRLFGNSYLPHHDYGRGGRGWRDLWQDLLSLILFNDSSVNELLFNNFMGIRMDGSNATIIGDKPGEFKADRNSIVRVWSDHGAWPLLTVKMYIDETNDYEFLLKEITYFDDQFSHYTKKIKKQFSDTHKLCIKKDIYYGSVLEHLLVQNIVAHFNTGKHGFVRIEDADWNDGLDMAKENGETIAFTHFYANNLRVLSELMKKLNTFKVMLYEALVDLLFEKISLDTYFDQVLNFTGNKVEIEKDLIIRQLNKLFSKRIKHINENAFDKDTFQSYITNEGVFLDNEKTLALTGQAMALLSLTATTEQAKTIAKKTRELLFDQAHGGYRLNTDYKRVLTQMGRAFGFAYGHKENGAIFNHMAIMYIYGLYQYDLVDEGSEGYQTLLKQSQKESSKLIAGIPEYFDSNGKGMYPYLTGSASWLLKLLRDQIFGIKLKEGKVYLEPKLKRIEFINQKASITTYIFGRLIKITYINPKDLDYGSYKVVKVVSMNREINITKDEILNDIEVYLDEL